MVAEAEDDQEMDMFDVRLKYTDMLDNLSASLNSGSKAAAFAIKHKDLSEDLHSCMLEALEKNNMNIRAKILYYLQQLCDVTAREHVYEFINMIKKDIVRIVDIVVSADDSGAANVKTVRIVLRGLQERNVLERDTVAELNDLLDERERSFTHPALGQLSSGASSAQPVSKKRLDKKLVDSRLEDDRERHKRLRENIWTVPAAEELEYSCELEGDVGQDAIGVNDDGIERQRNLVQPAR